MHAPILAEFGVRKHQNQTGTFQLSPLQLAKYLAETHPHFWLEFLEQNKRGTKKRLISGLTCHKEKGSRSLTQASAGRYQVWFNKSCEEDLVLLSEATAVHKSLVKQLQCHLR